MPNIRHRVVDVHAEVGGQLVKNSGIAFQRHKQEARAYE
jgi:hypothetical protein